MLPLYARDILQVGADGLGPLRAAPAVGATLTAIYFSVRPLKTDVGVKMLAAVVVFGADWTPIVQPVGPFPGEKHKTGSPVFYVARAMQQALASIGARKRALGPRTNMHLLVIYGKVLLLVPGLFLLAHFLRLVFLW